MKTTVGTLKTLIREAVTLETAQELEKLAQGEKYDVDIYSGIASNYSENSAVTKRYVRAGKAFRKAIKAYSQLEQTPEIVEKIKALNARASKVEETATIRHTREKKGFKI